MRHFFQPLRLRIKRIRHDIQNRKADQAIALVDADLEYAESQRNEILNPETLEDVFNPDLHFSDRVVDF